LTLDHNEVVKRIDVNIWGLHIRLKKIYPWTTLKGGPMYLLGISKNRNPG